MAKKTTKSPSSARAEKPAGAARPKAAAKPPKPARTASAEAAVPAKASPPARQRPAAVEPEAGAAPAKLSNDELRKQLITKARARAKTPRAAAFTLDDVRGELERISTSRSSGHGADAARPAGQPANHNSRHVAHDLREQRQFGAASLADILGYNPTVNETPANEEDTIDKRFVRYYRLLIQLRDHVNSGLTLHTEDTLKRSNREDSGDLSGYGQHMADAGTDNFDRDFALSLVSNEQEALFEIEEAIKRIKKGNYGICELTGKPISKDRLLAVPFARYSVESQAEIEKMKRRSSQRGGVFGDATGEEGAKFLEEDAD